MYATISYIILFVGFSTAQNPNCDFSQNVQVGVQYYIYSPNYPQSYGKGEQCRWVATCPVGYNCRLDCDDIDIPQSPSCSVDRLLISRSGDPQLTSAEYFCGRGTVTVVSTGRTISVGLITTSDQGGRFSCRLNAQAAATDPACSCGYQRSDRIVGGETAKPNEYPMMAGIVYVEESNSIKCGGVIISKSYIVTAAHCVVGKSLNAIAVVVGEHDVSTGADSSATQAFRVMSYNVHPQFTPSNYDYDVAVIRLLGQIQFSALVGPVCLPFKFKNYNFSGDIVTILGWGTLMPGGETSNVLRKVNVNVVSQASCRQSFSTLTDRQMCTYARGKDACQDDSGGPVLYTDPSNGLLYNAGIVSYGRFCASTTPGVNTRITAVLDWIVATAPDNYCQK